MATALTSKARTVGEIMSSPAVTAGGDETIATVAQRMRDDRVGSVIVVDGDRPVGILTERDVLRATGSNIEPNRARVDEWMTRDPDSVSPERTAADAFASLAQHGYRHFPVVEDGRLADSRWTDLLQRVRPVARELLVDLPFAPSPTRQRSSPSRSI